ncbi:MAG: hypothetical protein COX29_00615 [Candidatus Moranbacteria bacterium CG23_combo_of_CG06-09_8_20_14_all_35_22]|nr:MAG: hypothetical protein COX29_00615 [Candidatus Moranbacteria bacterium CG23_combo_of_CG06-09_8_20_14_all_35_22]
MKKIKKISMYFLGILSAFVFGKINALAQLTVPSGHNIPMYGSPNAILFNIFSWLALLITFFVTLTVGIIVFIRWKKRKNVEKDS